MSSKITQRTLLSCIVVGLFLLATYWWWVPRLITAAMLLEIQHDTAVETVPGAMSLSTALLPGGKTYTLGALTLTTPWTDEERRADTALYSLSIVFNSPKKYARALILIKDPSLHASLIDANAPLHQFFGPTLTTNRTTYDYLMQLTPSQVHLFSSSLESSSKTLLLFFKDKMIIGGGSVQSISTPAGMHGYLAQKSASTTVIEFFAPDDQEYTLVLRGATNTELGSILGSLKER